ncbi:MAG: TadE/TadG family type IV pilus assembly protein [Pseudomonadota bacterium]
MTRTQNSKFGISLIRRLGRDRKGTSAVEFALVLPLMLLLYFGGAELSDAIVVDRKVTSMTSAVGDLVAQSAIIDRREMDNIFEAASAVISPYDSDPIELLVSSIEIDEDGNGIVVGSEGFKTSGRAVGSQVTIPEELQIEGTFLVMAEGSYVYKPFLGQMLTESITFEDQFFLRPRVSAEVEFDL